MLALRLGEGSPRLDPDIPDPKRVSGEALVSMRLAGICDTDLQLARGYMGFVGVPGHEFVGEVLEADDEAWRGARVVADINAGCGSCPECITRDGHHCPRRSVLGILGRGGALAERLVVPERCLVKLPACVSDEQAVFAEPLAAALHVRNALPSPATRNASVAVLGDGKLGLLIALALHASKVPVTCVGHHRDKLALLPRAVRTLLEDELTSERFGVVVEATGSARGLERAIQLTEPRGTVVLKTTLNGQLGIDLSPVVVHELRLIGSRCGDLKAAVGVLEHGALDPTPLIQKRYPLECAVEAFEAAGSSGALKVLVEGSATRS